MSNVKTIKISCIILTLLITSLSIGQVSSNSNKDIIVTNSATSCNDSLSKKSIQNLDSLEITVAFDSLNFFKLDIEDVNWSDISIECQENEYGEQWQRFAIVGTKSLTQEN